MGWLAHRLGDVDALAVEPVLAHVAADHETVIERLPADTPQPVSRNTEF